MLFVNAIGSSLTMVMRQAGKMERLLYNKYRGITGL